MPTSRHRDPDSAAALRSREQEWKRSRGAIACAECRRLKLKCDKTVPCTSCKRRGCASICPNGSLVTGQGTRFVLADTDRLHSKITEMSERIRQLEDALTHAHLASTEDPHPLLKRDFLKIKSIIDLHSAVDALPMEGEEEAEEGDGSEALDIFGTLAVHEDGGSTFYGRSAGQEGEHDNPVGSTPPPVDGSGPLTSAGSFTGLPPDVIEISGAFPDAKSRHTTRDPLEKYLPLWPRASQLCALYLQQAPWFFGAVKERQLREELLPHYYSEARGHTPSLSPQPQATSHDLGLLFVILCFGALVDEALPPAPGNPEADRYYMLTKAALALDPVTDHAPTVATVQALSLMAIYQGLVANEYSIESTWTLMGMSTKLAQSLTPAETQKRRALFWELFITDCWQSLATGRLATFSLPFVDCELPQDPEQRMDVDGSTIDSFPHWKARFGQQCVSHVVQGILTARPPKYSIIVELDRKIRDMELPKYATGPPPENAGLDITMQHYMPHNYRHLTLLYVHRAFFAQGLCDQPLDPLRSQYAPSILSGYRSAVEILTNLRNAFNLFPAQIARFWVLWTHAFSSAVMLALIPVRAPQSKMAHTALLELQQARDLFEKAEPYGGRSVKMVAVVRRHFDKAAQTFHTARTEAIHRVPEIFPTSSRDEFAVFSGVTSTMSAPKRPQTSRVPTYGNASNSHSGSTTDLTMNTNMSEKAETDTSGPDTHSSVPSQQEFVAAQEYPAEQVVWGDVHSTLVDQLATFNRTLDAQISTSGSWQGRDELDNGGMQTLQYPATGPSYSPEQYQVYYPPGPPATHAMPPPPQPGPSHSYTQPAGYLPAHAPPQIVPQQAYYQQSYSSYSTLSVHTEVTPSTSHAVPSQATYYPTPIPAPNDASMENTRQHQLWNVPHNEVETYVQNRPPNPRARDRVLRQSGDLSLTEAWTAFLQQMDGSGR
ncbi:hypothetical protein OF83DRAFT_1163006 [Amylostereum chailletii]|nr:hypothetical protein OF83DRAFT_1163006 [Amylostereum chailletii]